MRKSPKAFTLLEIMIVVGIIGIVLAIAVPAFIRARENSRGRGCQENLSKIQGAKEQYAFEFKQGSSYVPSFQDLIQPAGCPIGEGYLKKTPTCPANASYDMGTLEEDVLCLYTGPSWATQHELP